MKAENKNLSSTNLIKVKSIRNLTSNSDSTSTKNYDESININEKRQVSFPFNFLCVIEVESWKEYNFDVTEQDPEWHKVEPEKTNVSNYGNNSVNHNKKIINKKKDKDLNSCGCEIF